MKHFSILAGVIALFLVKGSGLALPDTTPSDAGYFRALADLQVERPIGFTAGCVSCPLCHGGTTPGGPHSLGPSGSGQLMIPPGEDHGVGCASNNCMEFHYFDFECGGEALTSEEQRSLWVAATGHDVDAMLGALEQYPEWIKLNLDHESLQLYNCIGSITASIPLHPTTLAELRSAFMQ